MKQLVIILFTIGLPFMGMGQSLERDVIATSGGFESSANMSLSYTVGEAVVETYSQSSLILTQGFQQPLPQSSSGIERPEPKLSVSAYPNPTTDQVILEMEAPKKQTLSIRVLNFQGKVLETPFERQVFNGKTRFQVNMAGYGPGTYILRLTNNQGERIHTVEVQKIN